MGLLHSASTEMQTPQLRSNPCLSGGSKAPKTEPPWRLMKKCHVLATMRVQLQFHYYRQRAGLVILHTLAQQSTDNTTAHPLEINYNYKLKM